MLRDPLPRALSLLAVRDMSISEDFTLNDSAFLMEMFEVYFGRCVYTVAYIDDDQ